MSNVMIVEDRGPLPPVAGRGRKLGSGPNLRLLKRLKVGGTPVWDVDKKKMLSLRQSARLVGIRFKARAIPDIDGSPTELYVIQRIK